MLSCCAITWMCPTVFGSFSAHEIVGNGINLAERVMSSGDAGHILVSLSVASNLIQIGDWEAHLHDLGEHEVVLQVS